MSVVNCQNIIENDIDHEKARSGGEEVRRAWVDYKRAVSEFNDWNARFVVHMKLVDVGILLQIGSKEIENVLEQSWWAKALEVIC